MYYDAIGDKIVPVAQKYMYQNLNVADIIEELHTYASEKIHIYTSGGKFGSGLGIMLIKDY